MQTIKIFIASSSELKKERKELSLFLYDKNPLLENKNISLQPVRWEKLQQSFSGNRIQNYFNEELLKCDIAIFLFYTKIGKFTNEELEIAFKQFQKIKEKLIYVCFKTDSINIDDIKPEDLKKRIELKEKIAKEYQQLYCKYENIPDLLNQISDQLDLVIDKFNQKKPANTYSRNTTICLKILKISQSSP